VLTDAQGNLITGVPYISDSGTRTLQNQVLVPEAGTSLLLIGGTLSMLAFARRYGAQAAERAMRAALVLDRSKKVFDS
jgi:hypothetical protein